jgi:uracil-DNA glycosylase family 4
MRGMALSGPARALWHALDLGPLWRRRSAAPGAGAEPQPAAAETGALDWDALERAVAGCTTCGLSRTRTQTVFGTGSRNAAWMIVGEAPGAEEDARGEPFVGQAGRLLDNMLASIGLARGASGEGDAAQEPVYIANVLKCRPPGNRNPEADEVAACAPYLRRQIDLLQPRMIVAMGRFAAQVLLASGSSIASLRGRVHQYASGPRRYPVIVTYHPAYLLRTPADKSKVWDDLCLARMSLAAPGAGTA